MSEDDLPTRPKLLSMVRPAQLFGERLGDGRSVRKRSVGIAQTFRDTESAVFQQVRLRKPSCTGGALCRCP